MTYTVLLLFTLTAFSPQEEPVLTQNGGLHLVIPEKLLKEKRVNRQLNSGLTLSLVFRFEVGKKASRRTGAVLMEVRYELWDEVFYVTIRGDKKTPEHLVIKSFDELVQWCRNPGLPLPDYLGDSGETSLRLRVSIHPFSPDEQQRAMQWVRLSGDHGTRAIATSDSTLKRADPQETTGIINTLLASSIKRSSILTYSWTLKLP